MTKQEQKDQAYREYEAIQKPAWEEYETIKEKAYKEYETIISPASREYEAIRILAFEKYQAKCKKIDEQDEEDIKIIDGKRYKLID